MKYTNRRVKLLEKLANQLAALFCMPLNINKNISRKGPQNAYMYIFDQDDELIRVSYGYLFVCMNVSFSESTKVTHLKLYIDVLFYHVHKRSGLYFNIIKAKIFY